MSDGVEFLWGLILVLSRFVLAMIGFAIGFAAVFALTAGNNHALRVLVGLVARAVAALGGLGRYVSPGSLLRLRH